jgi:CBS domain-containing protein
VYTQKLNVGKSLAPITVSRDETVKNALELLTRHRIHRVWAVDGDSKLCGVLSLSDVIRIAAN